MTMEEYEHRFLELSQYFSNFFADENDNCKRFKDGLRDAIKILVLANDFFF